MSLLLLSTRGRSWFAVSLMYPVGGDGFALNEAFHSILFYYYTVPNWYDVYFARIFIFWLWTMFEFVSSLTAGYNLTLKGACFVKLKSTSL